MSDVYDSEKDTKEHIAMVKMIMDNIIHDLIQRSLTHDNSKLATPEKEIFDEYTPKLKTSTYGSEEYQLFLRGMKVALDHHYKNNRHHPQHFENGIGGMTLIDIVEMLCDWLAATKRHADGDIMRSIELNQNRFGYGDEFKQILINTANLLQSHISGVDND